MNNDETQPVEISTREAGRRGGNTVKAKYAGTDFYQKIGSVGAQRTKEKYGTKFYQEIGAKGGAKVNALIEAGKSAQGKIS